MRSAESPTCMSKPSTSTVSSCADSVVRSGGGSGGAIVVFVVCDARASPAWRPPWEMGVQQSSTSVASVTPRTPNT